MCVEVVANYLFFCFFLQLLTEVCSAEVIKDTMLPVVLKLAEDPVANVRFNVARTLTRLGTSIDAR